MTLNFRNLPAFVEVMIAQQPFTANSSRLASHSLRHILQSDGPSPSRRGSRSGNESRTRCERSEEHTSELQSRLHLVCRLLLEKKKKRSFRFRKTTYQPQYLLGR